MSTNYYCDTEESQLHLGKRSAGWRFTFHAEPGHFTSFDELVGFLENTPCEISDEYGSAVDPVEFIQMAATWGDDRENGGHRDLDCWCGEGPGTPHGGFWSREQSWRDAHYLDDRGHNWTRWEVC